MYIANELIELIGKEILLMELDDLIDYHYEGYFEPEEFTEKNRLYKCKNYYIDIQYTIDKNTISMLDIVKITNIKAFEK